MAVGLVLEGRSVAMLWKTPTTLTHSLTPSGGRT